MPQMYRAGGITRFFRSPDEGRKSGFYLTFSEMANAQRKPAPLVEPVVMPVIEAAVVDAPVIDGWVIEDGHLVADERLTREKILQVAKEEGLDTTVHHTILRKQVEELVNAESGDSQPGVSTDTD
jgi:hypothetical protein